MNVGQVRATPEVTLYTSHLLPLYIRLLSQIYINSHVEIDCARSTLQLSWESIEMKVHGSWFRIPRETDFTSQIEKL